LQGGQKSIDQSSLTISNTLFHRMQTSLSRNEMSPTLTPATPFRLKPILGAFSNNDLLRKNNKEDDLENDSDNNNTLYTKKDDVDSD